MMQFIKNHRHFILTMVIMVAVIAALGLKVVQQRAQVDELQNNITALEAEFEVKKAAKDAAIAAMNQAKEDNKVAKKAQSDAKKAADALAKELKTVQAELQKSETAQTESLAALNSTLDMLAADAAVDPQALQAALETAVTALGGTMPGADTEGEGTEK